MDSPGRRRCYKWTTNNYIICHASLSLQVLVHIFQWSSLWLDFDCNIIYIWILIIILFLNRTHVLKTKLNNASKHWQLYSISWRLIKGFQVKAISGSYITTLSTTLILTNITLLLPSELPHSDPAVSHVWGLWNLLWDS